ncbi:MAG: hypothetical protein WCK11_03580 [Candidatus Falkowbacteria bacterium]
MAVLVEGISVIIKNEAIEKYFGTVDDFVARAPNQTACCDQFITRIGFMSPSDTGFFVRTLEKIGFAHLLQDQAADFLLVDQVTGPTSGFDWCEFKKIEIDGHEIIFCKYLTDTDGTLHFPSQWNFEQSLYNKSYKIGMEEIQNKMQCIGVDGHVEVWEDKETGQQFYIGRTSNLF